MLMWYLQVHKYYIIVIFTGDTLEHFSLKKKRCANGHALLKNKYLALNEIESYKFF